MNIQTFTTRIDTLFGVTFIVLAPENSLVLSLTKPEKLTEVENYIKITKTKSEIERQASKEKTGVFTGSYVRHPLNNKEIPVWVSDYVLNSYGTGAIMAVPAHDERDFEFAKKFNLPITTVITKDKNENLNENVYTENGIMVNSEGFDGLENEEAKTKILQKLGEKATKKTNYKFRDWVFGRQRYWGEPFPFEYHKTED
jgi:leucyl-tRNA synthetase